jgi:hypothetical protein
MEAGGSDDGEDEDFDEEDELGLRFFVLHATHLIICSQPFYYYFPWYIFVPYDLHIAMPQTLQRNCTIPSRSSSATTL